MKINVLLCLLCVLAVPAWAQNAACNVAPQVPDISVDLNVTQPGIDHSLVRQELRRFDINTVSPYGPGAMVHVNGLMRGAISLETQSALAWQHLSNGENNCFWFNNVKIVLRLNPTIYLAREIPENTCLYREVLQHEYKHFNTDVQLAQDYRATLKSELTSFVTRMGVLGPYPMQMQASAQGELGRRLEQAISAVNERMKAERMRRQALIDTREEYERVAASCPADRSLM